MKRCTICQQEFPATAEYFTRDRGNKSGLRPQCKTCYRQKQAAWRKSDRERYREYGRQYYLRSPEPAKQRAKVWAKTASGKRSKRAYYRNHKKRLSAYARTRYQANRGAIIERSLRWQRDNPARRQVIRQRRAARIAALPVNFTDADWQFALEHFNGCCAACGRPPGLWHTLAADHWVALANDDCPGTIPGNIVPLCHGDGGCNNAKQDRKPVEWLESQFGMKQAQAVNKRIQEFFSQVRVT